MSCLTNQIRTTIENFVASQDGHQIPVDILRVFQEEAEKMKETQEICDTIDADPFEQFEELPTKTRERLKRLMRVTECERLRTGEDNARIHAVVAFPTCNNLQLTFLYERKPRKQPDGSGKGAHIMYTIELSHNYGQRERLLEVQVWASKNVPSTERAVCIQDAYARGDSDDDDGWEDIEDEEQEEYDSATRKWSKKATGSRDHADAETSVTTPQAKKKQKLSTAPTTTTAPSNDSSPIDNDAQAEGEDYEPTHDQYIAFMDPEVLQNFLESAGLLPMNEATAFFLLMTFPFYEHEWDLVGYILEQVFGSADSDDDDDMSK